MGNSAPHLLLYNLAKKYGPFMFLQLGSVETLVVSSEKMAKEVMRTHEQNFSNKPVLRGLQKLSYNGLDVLSSPSNDYWREMKKIFVLHLCSTQRVESFRVVREEEVSSMIERINGLAKSSKVVNLSELVMSLSTNILCMVAFGKKYEVEGNQKSRFHCLLNEAQAMMVSFFVSDYFPLLGWVDRVTGLSSRLDRCVKELDEFYDELIDDHLNPSRNDPTSEDFLDTLLRLQKEKSTAFDLTLDHIKGLLMNVLVGGSDPVVAVIIWVMTCLIRNPESMEKAQKEVRMIAGKKDMMDEDDVRKLPYLQAIIKETFRLYPPAPLIVPHESVEKCIIDGYEIKPKTLVYINTWAIGRDPESWDNPEKFIPERFLDSTVDFRGQHIQLIPFGSGRRLCPGITMAGATMGLTLANLLYLFDWAPPNGMKREDIDTDPLAGLVVHKKNHLCLLATSYRHA